MHDLELVLFLLLAVALLARRLGAPYPTILVVGGLALGFIPGLPRVELAPAVVFLVFLPPLLHAAGWRRPWRGQSRPMARRADGARRRLRHLARGV